VWCGTTADGGGASTTVSASLRWRGSHGNPARGMRICSTSASGVDRCGCRVGRARLECALQSWYDVHLKKKKLRIRSWLSFVRSFSPKLSLSVMSPTSVHTLTARKSAKSSWSGTSTSSLSPPPRRIGGRRLSGIPNSVQSIAIGFGTGTSSALNRRESLWISESTVREVAVISGFSYLKKVDQKLRDEGDR
jgi:hypothetical protein